MKNEYNLTNSDGVDRAIGARGIVFHYFENVRAAKSLQRLCGFMLLAQLSKMQRVPEELSHRFRQIHQVFLTASDPIDRLFWCAHGFIIPEKE